MSSVVFYISGHGFGHASRQCEVIHAFAARRPDVSILLRTAVTPALLSRSLRVPFTLVEGPCDSGLLQHDSVTHDDEGTARVTHEFYATFNDRINDECRRLANADVRLIVGDIPPLAFEVAARLGVSSVAIANFTWDWIYEWQPGLSDDHALLDLIRRAYGKATLALQLPLSPPFTMFPAVEPLPFVARTASRTRAEVRAQLGLPADGRVALLSFGGYGLHRLDVAALDCLDTWTVLLTDRILSTAPASDSVVFLPETLFAQDLRYEDLIGAVDVVVTKPGYGILAEAVANGTAVLYTSRGRFREYDLMVEQMPRFLRCRFLDQQALFAGRWQAALEALMAQPAPPERVATDGAARAADRLAAFIG